jgi:4-hydroxy-3-methylbut-2-enyl diphosphate reductase
VEPIGTAGEAPENTILIETADDARAVAVPNPEKVAYLTQTTLAVDDTRDIIAVLTARFPNIVAPPSADICYATTNRQQAVKEIARDAEVVFVIGSKNSSNSNRLREVAEVSGARAYRIDRVSEIDPAWLAGVETVGVTAGASAPEVLVDEVLQFLKGHGGERVEEVVAVPEHVRFPLPQELTREAAVQGKRLDQLQKHTITQGMVMRK